MVLSVHFVQLTVQHVKVVLFAFRVYHNNLFIRESAIPIAHRLVHTLMLLLLHRRAKNAQPHVEHALPLMRV